MEWNCNKCVTKTKCISWKFTNFLLQSYFPSLPKDSTPHVFTDLILSIQFQSNKTEFWSVSPINDTQMHSYVVCICKYSESVDITWHSVSIWASSGVYSLCLLFDGEVQGSLINQSTIIISSFEWRVVAQCYSGDFARPLVSKMCYCISLCMSGKKIKK